MVLGTSMLNRNFLFYFFSLISFPTWGQDASFNFNTNDFVSIPSNASLQAETGMTIECWVNPESDTYADY